MIDYVKCQECGIEKSREDTFLDIPLPIRPFGCTNAYGCIVRIYFLQIIIFNSSKIIIIII